MKETIILAPGLESGELAVSLARFGVNRFNQRLCDAGELARLALMRSGLAIPEDMITARDARSVVADAMRGEDYFKNASWSDVEQVSAALIQMRSLVAEGDEDTVLQDTLSKGIFQEKNRALLQVYRKYMWALKNRPGRPAVDPTALIRRAAQQCDPMDAEFVVLEEYPLSPLELALLKRLSGGRWKTLSLRELYQAPEKPVRVEAFRDCYGAPNEVEAILADIYAGKQLDQCTVAVTDAATYSQLFFDNAILYEIPVTFGCGVPIVNSNPARLLALYSRWVQGGFFTASALSDLLRSPAFDRKVLLAKFPNVGDDFRMSTLLEYLSGLRLTNDAKTNRERLQNCRKAIEEEVALSKDLSKKDQDRLERRRAWMPILEIVGEELALPPEDFIARYSYIRKGSGTSTEHLLMTLDQSAVRTISDELRVIRPHSHNRSLEDIVRSLWDLQVAVQPAEAGKLHITDVDNAACCLRENLYLSGLSASLFPGRPRENCLLLDSDLELFGEGAACAMADNRILARRSRFLSLVRLGSALDAHLFLSYAGHNVSELKRDNASSLVFEVYREMEGEGATFQGLRARTESVHYFQPAISRSRCIGEAYTEGVRVTPAPRPEPEAVQPVDWTSNRRFAPTSLADWFACPKLFMLKRLLGIPEPDTEDPMEVLTPIDRGNLAHTLMEKLHKSEMTREQFQTLSGETFDRFLAQHPPAVNSQVQGERESFLEMMGIAYDQDPDLPVVFMEEALECDHPSGIRLIGFPDRVEGLADGTCRVVDFKTGGIVSQRENDLVTCLQVIIYGYMLKKAKGYSVSGGEFRYLRLGQSVPCVYDEVVESQLATLLARFREGLQRSEFPLPSPADQKTVCRYCKYSELCGKDQPQQEV